MRRVSSGRSAASFIAAVGLVLGGVVIGAAPASAAPVCESDAGVTTCEFTYTGANEQWTVPGGVTTITADVYGAQGGSFGKDFTMGGFGGRATSPLPVTPGEVITLAVGGAGGSVVGGCHSPGVPFGGFNGGGAGAAYVKCPDGAGGGGASDIRLGGAEIEDRVLIAGGGGGSVNQRSSSVPHNGGAGGGLVGGTGIPAARGGGAGGTQDSGGANGLGGNGFGSGGGGGGGYFGGEGGITKVWDDYPSGGGGSGYGPAGTVFETGVHAGNGLIQISFADTATTTQVVPSATSITAGEAIDLTATVADARGADLSGTVEFFSGSDSLGTAPGDSAGNANLLAVSLPVGEHEVTATYSGNDDVAPSTSEPVTVAVAQIVTSTTLDANPTPGVYGEEVVLTASIDHATGTGEVDFIADGHSLGVVSLSDGTASLPVSGLLAGDYEITAEYSGDENHTGSTSDPVTVTVSQAATTTQLTIQPETVTVGGAVELTATVLGGDPTGDVDFFADGQSLGVASLVDGTARIAVSDLPAGTHHLSAEYSGDENHAPSVTVTSTFTVEAKAVEPGPGKDETGAARRDTADAKLASTGSSGMFWMLATGTVIAGAGVLLMCRTSKRA